MSETTNTATTTTSTPGPSSPKKPRRSSRKPKATARIPRDVTKPSDLNGTEGNPDYDRALRQLLCDGIVNAVKGSVAASRDRQRRAQDLLDAGAEITRPPRYQAPSVSPKPEDFTVARFDSNGDLVGVTSYGTKVRVHPDGSSTIQAGPGYDPVTDVEVAAPLEVEASVGEPGSLIPIGGGIQARQE